MYYIQPDPNPSGAYPAPQSSLVSGLLPLTAEQAAIVSAHNGFVTIAEQSDGTVMVTPNTAAWEAWKAAEAAKPKPEPEPTIEEKLAALEQENKQLKEDAKLLRAQVDAQTEQIEFYDDCIAEMAAVVYA